MALGSTETMAGQRTLTAFFDSSADAQSAVQRLAAAGIPRSAIDIRSGASTAAGGPTTGATTGRDTEPGFWEIMKDIFMPEDDRAAYAEGLRRGGHVVVVRTDAQHYEQALDILDDEGTIDLDQRAESWRKEGWQGSGHTSSLGTGGATTSALGAAGSMGQTGHRAAATGTTGTGSSLTAGREEVIPISEEHLRVGKREVSHGRVRVRSYVVETPVSEQVGLREEHVSVERRPVDRAATGTENLFKERVIEAEERAEEAVVAKEARVKEELVIRKEADQRTQTISDTVRRTEVEVEDDRAGTTRTGTTGTTGSDRKIS